MKEDIREITYNGEPLSLSVRYQRKSDDLIVLLHGLGCSKESFNEVWKRSDLTEYSILSFDLPGFGHSKKSCGFSCSMGQYALLSSRLIKTFPHKRFHIIAHSMGGAVGLLLADDILARSITFSNLEGNLIGDDCGYLSRKVASISYEEFKKLLFPKLKEQSKEGDFKNFSFKEADSKAFYKSAKSLVECSESGILIKKFKNLKARKCYFYGEFNAMMPVLQEISDIDTCLIRKSGHFLMNDNPSECYDKIYKFLRLDR